jgi:hypothetical protein
MEKAWALSNEHWPMNMVAVLRLAPVPDTDLLQIALRQAQQRHPALHARIHRRRRTRLFLYDDVPPIPLNVIEAKGADDWIGATEAALNTSLPTDTGPLLAMTLVRRPAGADLVAAIHHAIVDATSGVNLLSEVLTTYGELAAGRPAPHRPSLPVPPPSDNLFPHEYRDTQLRVRAVPFGLRTIAPEVRWRAAMRRVGGPGVDPRGQSQIHPANLDPEATAALSGAARRRRTTLASVIQAAALSTTHRLRYDTREGLLRTFSFPDLRPYLDPAVPPEPLACYMAATWQDIALERGDDLWDVAATVQDRVEASLRGGAKFIASAMIVPVIRMVMATGRLRMGNVAVSHTGYTNLDDGYGPLAVDDVRGFLSNMAVGPELALRTGLLHGRLTIDLVTSDTDMDRSEMARLGEDVVATLREAAED